MKLFRYIALICVTAVLASCEESEIFYTYTYPIVQVEATATIEPPKLDPTPAPEPEPEPAPTAATTWEPSEEEKKLIETISNEVLTAAPIAVGGYYTLDFTRHDGGTLTVDTATDAGQFISTFDKTPGKGELNIRFGEQEYTAKIDSYADESGQRKVLLTVDFTKHYQTLYPDKRIGSVIRKEYTSTPSK